MNLFDFKIDAKMICTLFTGQAVRRVYLYEIFI